MFLKLNPMTRHSDSILLEMTSYSHAGLKQPARLCHNG
jgi:hypothetical protein